MIPSLIPTGPFITGLEEASGVTAEIGESLFRAPEESHVLTFSYQSESPRKPSLSWPSGHWRKTG